MPLRAASGCSLRHPCLLCRTNKNSWAWKHGPEPGETAALTVAPLWLSTDRVVGLGVNYVLCNCVWYVEGKRRTMILNTDYPNTSQTCPPWRSGRFQWLFLLLVLTQGTNFPILFSSMTKNKTKQKNLQTMFQYFFLNNSLFSHSLGTRVFTPDRRVRPRAVEPEEARCYGHVTCLIFGLFWCQKPGAHIQMLQSKNLILARPYL